MRRKCGTGLGRRLGVAGGTVAATATRAAAQPAIDREMQRSMTRADRSLERLMMVFAEVGALWLWVIASVLAYVLVAMLASVLDRRMFALRGSAAVLRYVVHGARTFFRLARDARTPAAARVILVLGLVYWLFPFDPLVEWSYFTSLDGTLIGFADDIFVAVIAAKAFLLLCPDALVAEHALAVERRRQPQAARHPAASARR